MTTAANPPHRTARSSRLTLLVALVLAALSLGGGLAAATPASGLTAAVASPTDEVPAHATTELAIASRSVSRGTRRHIVTHRVATAYRRRSTRQGLVPRCLHRASQMRRGPPASHPHP